MQNVWIIPLQYKRNAESPNDSQFILVSKYVLSLLHPIYFIYFSINTIEIMHDII